MLSRLTLLLALTFAAHANIARAETAETAPCAAPKGWEEVAATKPSFLVFGELHGTTESPQFIENLVCALALQNKRILLAVEQVSDLNGNLQAAWKLPPEEFKHYLTGPDWNTIRDGVASKAMAQMMTRAHSLNALGQSVDIVAFNGSVEDEKKFAHLPSQGPHEAAQAENIANAASAKDYDYVIVLVGGLHASKHTIEWRDPPFEPMAKYLEQYGKVTSFMFLQAGGTAWYCNSEDICGTHPWEANAKLKGPPYMALNGKKPLKAAARVDGYFWLGPITSSPPIGD